MPSRGRLPGTITRSRTTTRRGVRERGSRSALPATQGQRLSGVLGTHAPTFIPASRIRPSPLSALALRRPCRDQRSRHAPVPLGPGLRPRHRGIRGRRASSRQLSRPVRRRSHNARPPSGTLVAGWAGKVESTLERHCSTAPHGLPRREAGIGSVVLDRWLGRISTGASPHPRLPPSSSDLKPRCYWRRHSLVLGNRP